MKKNIYIYMESNINDFEKNISMVNYIQDLFHLSYLKNQFDNGQDMDYDLPEKELYVRHGELLKKM